MVCSTLRSILPGIPPPASCPHRPRVLQASRRLTREDSQGPRSESQQTARPPAKPHHVSRTATRASSALVQSPPRRLRVHCAFHALLPPQRSPAVRLVARAWRQRRTQMWLTRVLSSTTFLGAIIFTIPLAFDIGGRTCGLAFSLALSVYYFLFSALRLATPDTSRVRWAVGNIVAWAQWLAIPTLLIWSLNKFSIDAANNSGWVEKTFGASRSEFKSVNEWIFGSQGLLQSASIGAWDKTLRYSTPVFQLAEGFCSLLVIQAAGQITRWVVNKERGDSWMIGLLVASASIISTSVYFLWRITNFPAISNVDAILIGVAITTAIFLGGWGIISARGNPVESSLLIFTDYQPSPGSVAATNVSSDPALPPLPPIIMASYTTLLHAMASLPTIAHTGFNLMVGAVMTITPSVIISLAYRVFVMYAAARIIPAIRESGARGLSQEPSLDDDDETSKILGFLTWFSPSIIIAVYTSLLMQHFASGNGTDGSAVTGEWWTNQGGDAGGNMWRWINLAITMGLYAIELNISNSDNDGRLTSHWKTD
ncbi:ER membrane protein-like protein [Plenodomus tracheiphilus IPT5]|uniref:ER membrane protein-like protein n=1 Tax=Plenodomus tracheiphilus IPT5 TaxID=1408161 RepID=A0A6A7B0V1_9PLEO|nr:ER membrane protein-like protein [Plenodomus tracheiphilus IPT5]